MFQRILSRSFAWAFSWALLCAPCLSQKLIHTHLGDANQLRLGSEIRGAGDVDGDGLDDYLLGVEQATPNGQSSGEVRVYSGVTGLRIATFPGASAGDLFGGAAVGLGDLNGDGRSDVLVGAVGAGAGGEAYLVSGLDGSTLRTHAAASALDEFGHDVAALDDVDLDGVRDYAVGAPNDNSGPNLTSGAVYVFSGATGAQLFVVYGDDHLDDFGYSVRGVGDVDGDGRGDVFVGAPRDDDGGSSSGGAHLVSGNGGVTLWRAYGLAAQHRFGEALDGAGADMSGDGVPDLIVGTDDADYVRILSGVDGSTLRTVDSSASGGGSSEFGRGVCALGDIDGDALGEYAIGDSFAYLLGQVRVYSGATGDELYVQTWVDQNHGFAAVLANVGDLNGDGLHEFGVDAQGFDPPGFGNAGRVAIYSPAAPIGTRYCTPGTIGSSGRPASIQAFGSPTISEECLSLTAAGLPIATFGYFIAGTAQNSFTPGGSIGVICIGGANVARFNSISQVIRGPGGSIEVDLLAIPGNPPRPVMPGETWHFQCWFRDSTPAGTATSNFTDAVRITFQ